jgi:hypothetical protein
MSYNISNNSVIDDINSHSVIDDINSNGVLDQIPEELFTSNIRVVIPPIPPIPPIPGPVPCFLKSTKILTDNGEKLVEKLYKGMNLINHKGEKIKLIDIYYFKTHKNNQTHPCIIKKDTIINGYKCNSDLYISQEHCVLINNIFVPVKKLVKSQKIENNKDYYTYYHLITENYFTDVVISNGIPTETYGKIIKQCMNKDLYCYVKNHITKNGNRILLEKKDFTNLIEKFSTIQKIKKHNLTF